jgi:alpha-pyrone synthase
LAYLTQIATAVPEHRVLQKSFAEYYAGLSESEEIQRKIKFIGLKSGIETRHTVMEDLSALFKMSLSDKMKLYHKEAKALAIKAVRKLASKASLENVTDLVLVSCTGMSAPGLEFEIIKEFGLSPRVKRHNIHFMGCYAGITAMRQAQLICSNKSAKVLIVDIELCTLHFQKNFDNDYLLSNLLFSDGCAAAIVEASGSKGLKINDFNSFFVEETENEMSWTISDLGFIMTLDAKVPESLKGAMASIAVNKHTQLAMHPGGIQILKMGEKVFNQDMAPSYNVLRNYGNMSSATIYFILEKFLNSDRIQDEVLAMAFGPGLTLETARLQHV